MKKFANLQQSTKQSDENVLHKNYFKPLFLIFSGDEYLTQGQCNKYYENRYMKLGEVIDKNSLEFTKIMDDDDMVN